MRLIDAELLEPDADYDDGEFWAYSKTQIDNASTIKPEWKTGKWVPCSERLPEVDELVLVTDDSGGVKTVDVDRCGEYEASSKRFWYYTQNVVAWMPLPKAYEGKK